MSQPDRASSHTFQWGEDTAGYLVNPGTVQAPGRHSAGNLNHARPYIVSGNNFFVFPVGPEGFARTGAAGVSIHKYLNEVAADTHVFHREEGRIQLMGTFPGISSVDNMIDCLQILRSAPTEPGLVLYMPGVFEREQYVTAENWTFEHPEDNRDHSITYQISFILTGTGGKVSDPSGKAAPPNPTVQGKPKGKPTRLFTVKAGQQTLKQISDAVYGDAEKWKSLVSLNEDKIALFQRSDALNSLEGLPSYQLPTYRWPVGTKFQY